MAIVFECPSCEERLEMSGAAAGAKTQCPKCGAPLVVPDHSRRMPASSDDDYAEERRPPRKQRAWFIPTVLCLGLAAMCCVPATLIGLLVPAVQRVREAAARTATMNNMSQCAKAVHLCHDQNTKFPPYFGPYGEKDAPYSFHTHLLPFLDQAQLYRQQPPNPMAVVPPFLSTMDPTLSNSGAGATNYPVNIRLFYTGGGLGTLSPQTALIYPKMPDSFPDGLSVTLLFATKYHHCGPNGGSLWADTNALSSPNAATFGASMALWQPAPTQAACNPTSGTAVSFNVQSIQVAMCDASVRSVGSGISSATWQAVHTPGGADVAGPDWEGN